MAVQERFKNWAIFGTQKVDVTESFSMLTANETVLALQRYKCDLLTAAASADEGLWTPPTTLAMSSTQCQQLLDKDAARVLERNPQAASRQQQLLQQLQHQHPFCFFVSFFKPHPPILASESLYEHYVHADMERPKSLGSDTMNLGSKVIASRQVLQVRAWGFIPPAD